MAGKSPVTMMMRGKPWLHRQLKNAPGAIEPPKIYRSMAEANTNEAKSKWPDLFYKPGAGDDRLYSAAISIEELIEFETDKDDAGVNDFLETDVLPDLDKALSAALDNAPIYRLPVIFDRIEDIDHWSDGDRSEQTSAFLPDMINMQVINGHLLIPKPFGPRMLPDFAISVVSEVLEAVGLGKLAKGVTKDWISKRGLDKTEVWMRPDPATYIGGRNIFLGYGDAGKIAFAFHDGFGGKSADDIAPLIRKANRNAFRADGTLRDGWHKLTIPEQPSVDIFEAYSQIILESFGLTVHWVDSWYYHVRFGGIHCGTNVIRTPQTKGVKPWWKV
jgi:hypothetical protein